MGLVLKLENSAKRPDSPAGKAYLTMVTDEIRPDVIVVSTVTDANPGAKRLRAISAGAKFVPYDAPRPTPDSSSDFVRHALESIGNPIA